jgi:hypothetical protein
MSTPNPVESDVSVAEGAADVVPAQGERRGARLALNGLMALGLVGLGGLAAAGALSILGVHLTLPHGAPKAPAHPALAATVRPVGGPASAAGQPVSSAYVTQQVIARPVVAPVALAPHPEARTAAAAAPAGPRNVPTVATDRHAARAMQGLF